MLRLLKRQDDGTMVEIGTYEDGEFHGDSPLARAPSLEGAPEEEVMRSLDGPRVVAVQPNDQ